MSKFLSAGATQPEQELLRLALWDDGPLLGETHTSTRKTRV